jgi:hypothetical protein
MPLREIAALLHLSYDAVSRRRKLLAKLQSSLGNKPGAYVAARGPARARPGPDRVGLFP